MRNLPLFPNYFKWVVIAIILLDIIIAFVFRDFLKQYGDYSKEIMLTIISLALLILFWTKRKEDDEMFVQLRLNTMTGAIVFLIIYVLINNIFSLVADEEEIGRISAGMGVFTMMVFITLMFELQLRKLKKSNNEE
ncbi:MULTISPECIES: hypothetical protein [unclassified Myroides]|uniref:hypothetical protein n=1 Tax=unclassified Myroides TaxID=2642485 RepID=UPI00310177DB